MTLVEARATPLGVHVIGDLRVLDPHEVRRGFPYAILKVVVTQPHICVGFAGSVDAALDALYQVREMSDAEEVAATLVAYTERVDDVEFLVADATRNSIAVAQGGVRQAGGWIGDIDAHTLFQAAFAEEPPEVYRSGAPDDPDTAEHVMTGIRIHRAADAVLAASLVSVGEEFVRATSKNGTFEYMTSAKMVMGRDQTIPSGTWTTIQFGGAAEGGFAHSVLTPTTPGVGAVGIHFFQGRLGLLYAPLLAREPYVFREVSHGEFRDDVRERFGFDIQGIGIS
jgi:hypothetical protein